METKLIDFSSKTVYVGIDIHKRQWSVSIFSQKIHHRTFSQPSEPKALKRLLTVVLALTRKNRFPPRQLRLWILRLVKSLRSRPRFIGQ